MNNTEKQPPKYQGAFIRLSHDYLNDLKQGIISPLELNILIVLLDRAVCITGIATISFSEIGTYLKKPPNTVRNNMNTLRDKRYIYFDSNIQGKRSFEVHIANYPFKHKQGLPQIYKNISHFFQNNDEYFKVDANIAKSNITDDANFKDEGSCSIPIQNDEEGLAKFLGIEKSESISIAKSQSQSESEEETEIVKESTFSAKQHIENIRRMLDKKPG